MKEKELTTEYSHVLTALCYVVYTLLVQFAESS